MDPGQAWISYSLPALAGRYRSVSDDRCHVEPEAHSQPYGRPMQSTSLERLAAEELAQRMRFPDDELPGLEACFRVERDGHVQWLVFVSAVIRLEGAPFDTDEAPLCVAEDMAIHVEANLKALRGRFGIELPWQSAAG